MMSLHLGRPMGDTWPRCSWAPRSSLSWNVAPPSPPSQILRYMVSFFDTHFPSRRLLCSLSLWKFFLAASAFSERYLGSKTDSRAYTVRALRCFCSDGDGVSSLKVVVMGCFCPPPPQMANLVHRAHQLLQKQYLIIHPTADGKKALSSHYNAYLTGNYGISGISLIFSLQKKSIFSTRPNLSII